MIVLVVSPLLDLAIWVISHRWFGLRYPSALGYARLWAMSWVSAIPLGDSWDAMRAALVWFHQHPGGRLYQQLFFVEHIKFQYPPSSLLLFEGLSRLGITPSDAALNRLGSLFVIANVYACGAFAYVLARRSAVYGAQRWQFAMVAALGAWLFFPLLRAFNLGQIQSWINALFAFAALAWLTGRKQSAGVLIGLICLLKPQFALFMLWGLLRREWRFLAGWAGVLALGSIASLALFGWQNHLDYLTVLRALSRTGEAYIANQSANGLLNRLFTVNDPSVWQPGGFPPFNPIVYGGTLLSSALVVGAALLVPLRYGNKGGTRDATSVDTKGAKSGLLDFLGAALAFTIASPIVWDHHYGILPVIYIAVMFALLQRGASRGRSLLLTLLALSFLATGHWAGGSWIVGGALALFILLYAAGGVRVAAAQ